jgi:hypothetical protein
MQRAAKIAAAFGRQGMPQAMGTHAVKDTTVYSLAVLQAVVKPAVVVICSAHTFAVRCIVAATRCTVRDDTGCIITLSVWSLQALAQSEAILHTRHVW